MLNWEKVTQFDGPEDSPGFLLWQVSTRWRRQVETTLATIGLTHPQFVLLASVCWLTKDRKDVQQADLARHCGMDLNVTSQVLRLLEKKGFIKRVASPEDERSKYPRPTDEGAKLIKKAIPLVEEIDHKFFGTHSQKCVKILQLLT